MKEYKVAQGWEFFNYIILSIFIVLGCFVFIMPFIPFFNKDNNYNIYWFLIPLSIGVIVFCIVGILDTRKHKFIIDNSKNEIKLITFFSNKQLNFSEIKGFRFINKYTLIESNNPQKKNIKVITYLEKNEEIIEWISNNFINLEQVEIEKEKTEIINNEDFGWDIEQREEKLRNAHRVANIYNWTGGIISVWTLFLAFPYEYAILSCIAFPIIGLIIVKCFNGLVRFDTSKSTAYPTVFYGVLGVGISLFARAILDYKIFDYSNIWASTLVISFIFVIVFSIGFKNLKFSNLRECFSMIFFSLTIFLYSYGAVVTLNCFYDKSEPEIYDAIVLNKRFTSGKTTTYYIKLTSWGPQKDEDEVSISKDLYESLEIDYQVNIYFMKGKFNIPWFEILN